MELIDLEKQAFLYALKAIYFDQGGAVSSALDYYVAAGETLLEAARFSITRLKTQSAVVLSEGRDVAKKVGR